MMTHLETVLETCVTRLLDLNQEKDLLCRRMSPKITDSEIMYITNRTNKINEKIDEIIHEAGVSILTEYYDYYESHKED